MSTAVSTKIMISSIILYEFWHVQVAYEIQRGLKIVEATDMWFGGGLIRDMAYAYDMNLIAETPQDFQALIDYSTAYLQQCGMNINQAKSQSISI